MQIFVAGLFLALLASTGAWDQKFKSSQCYVSQGSFSLSGSSATLADLAERRMPLSIENFVALLEKYERKHSFANPDAVAEALIKRYRVDGITYLPSVGSSIFWKAQEQEEIDKQTIIAKVLTPTQIVPAESFEPREECSLHFMSSHSTDIYPHPGLDSLWDGTIVGRYRRSYSDMRSQTNHAARSSLPTGLLPADHPVENGVIQTPYGPVALGTLLAGIASLSNGNEASLLTIFGANDVSYMPQEMQSVRLNPQYVSTLSGDIGQAAMVSSLSTTTSTNYLGPRGRFGNSTAAPKIFTLETGYDGAVAYLTRAEIFAGIDAILIQNALRSQSNSLKLSHVLRMYYSDRGLPGYPHFKACNRMDAYKQLNDEAKTKEQALNFMYAYSHYFSDAKRHISENSEKFPEIERYYTEALERVWSSFSTFVGSYNYEDFKRCPTYNKDNIMCENWSDLLVVYSRELPPLEAEKQREYITHVAEMISVSETRSRLGVMDGKSGNWILEMTNVTNVADWGSNFTMDTQYNSGGSGGDIKLILDKMRSYYYIFYKTMNSTAENATANSQVVLWNVPKTAPNFEDPETQRLLREFRLDFPNVYFLLVGNNKGAYDPVLVDKERDFFKMDTTDPMGFAETISHRICQIPSVFVYPACDTLNVNFTNYNEQSHKFMSYVSPNYTTYAMIAPHNFQYSYRLKLKVESSDVSVCASRKSMRLDATVADDVVCQDGTSEFEFEELCGRYLYECEPVFLSIKGSPIGNQRCTDSECEFPNQLQYTISHDGMLCGAWCPTVSLMMMAMLVLLHLIWY